METFFVTYNTGEYDSYVDHVYSIDAETKESLLSEIYRASDAYVKYKNKEQNERQVVDDKFRPTNIKTAGEKQWKAYHQELNKHYEKFDYTIDISVFGNKLPIFDDIMNVSVEQSIKDSGLEILTVEEYIAMRRPEKEKQND